MKNIQKNFQDALASAGIAAEESISSIRTVRSFTGEEKSQKSYDKEIQLSYKYGRSLSVGFGIFNGLIGIISQVSTVQFLLLKPMHNIGKVSVNSSILYNNQQICKKTNLWTFQLILLFLLWKNSKNAISIFVLILMAGVFVSRYENSLLDLISLIIRKRIQAEIFQGMLSPIVIFVPCKLCVNLWTFLFFGLTNVVQRLYMGHSCSLWQALW